MAPDVHPVKIIETKNGNIVLEQPDLLRTSALSNSLYTYILSDEDILKMNAMGSDDERNQFLQLKTLKKGFTTMQLTLLAYVTSAPFHLNDYGTEPLLDLRSFIEFADVELINKMSICIKELGQIDPLSP